LTLSGIALVLAVTSWGDAALWYRDTPQNSATRAALPETPEGQLAFRLSIQPGDPPAKLVQILPTDIARDMSAQPYTLGAWIWASQPVEINSAQVKVFDGKQVFAEKILVTETPQFFALAFSPQGNTQRTWVLLQPSISLDIQNPVEIYYDGVVLAEGEFPVDQVPRFDKEGSSGTWGGIPFENLLRNGSAENSWFYLRPWADALGAMIFSDFKEQESFSLIVYTLVDWPSSGWFYRAVMERLFRTFWAKFAWGHVPLIGAKPYRILLFPALISIFGVAVAFWQRRKRLSEQPWDALFVLGVPLVLVWGMAFVRGGSYIFRGWGSFVVARYTYPVIIPTILIFATGWLVWLELVEKKLNLPSWGKYLVYAGGFLILDVLSLISIWSFYG